MSSWVRFVELNAFEHGSDLRAQSTLRTRFILDRIAQNVANFLFHGAAVADRAPLQLALDRIFQVANNDLGHIHLA